LPPGGTVTLKFSGGKKGDRPAAPGSDLSLTKEKGAAVLATSRVGVRVLLGEEKFATPVAAQKLPAPLQGVRLASGGWTGKGWLETNHLCAAYSAQVTDDGPVFKKVAIRYDFETPPGWSREGPLFYEATVRVAAGQEIAYVTEDYDLGDPKVYQPYRFKDEAEEQIWGWWSWRPHEAADNFCFSLSSDAFRPTHARHITNSSCTEPDKAGVARDPYSEREYALSFAKDRLEFTLAARNDFQPDQTAVYTLFKKDDPASDIVSLLPCMASRWRHADMLPHEPQFITQHTDTGDIRLYTSAKKDVFFRAPLHLGRREWAVATLRNPGVITEAKDYTVIAGMLKKYGALPLDTVKDWVLAWPEAAADAKAPPGGDVEKEYKDVIGQYDEYIYTALAWPNIGERTGINATPLNWPVLAERAVKLLASGSLAAERRTALRTRIAFTGYVLWNPEYLPPRKAGSGWGSLNMPVSVGSGRLREAVMLQKLGHPAAKAWVDASVKWMGYFVKAYFSPDGAPYSNPHYMGLMAAPLVDNAPILREAGALKDVKDTYPNYYNYAHFLVDLTIPKDLRLGKRISPTEGDAYWEEYKVPESVAPLFKESDPALCDALLWASGKSDRVPPGLKSAAYPGYGAFLRSHTGDPEESVVQVRFGHFTIDHTHNDAGSVIWYARGVPLAMDFAAMYTPCTFSNWLHGTLTYDHAEHDPPVPCPGMGKPGCFYTGKVWYDHKCEPHTVLQAAPEKTSPNIAEIYGRIAAFAAQPAADYVRGEAGRRTFAKIPYYYRPDGLPCPWAANTVFEQTELKQPFTWVRQFAFVKDEKPAGPHYLVIADDLAGNRELEPAFNFYCLARDVKEAAARQFHFDGQHGIDLDMFVLAPAAGRVQLGEWGHKQGFLIGEKGLEENQKLVRAYGKPDGKGFLVVLYPRKPDEPQPKVEALADGKLVRMTLPGETHWILLSQAPASVSDGPVKLSGTAAVAKQWKDGRAQVTLLAGGAAECGGLKLESTEPGSK